MQVLVDALALSSGKACTKKVEVHPNGDLAAMENQIRENLGSDHGVRFGHTCAIRMHGVVGQDGKVYPIPGMSTPQIFPYK